MRITKSFVDKLSPPAKSSQGGTNQCRHYDASLTGFGIRITSGGTKAFFIEKRIDNKLRRITIGQYPALTVEQARKEAQKLLGQIATGIDPLAEKQTARIKGVTLKSVFTDYLKARKTLKPNTLYDYQRVMREAFSDWQNKPLADISKDMISKRHSKLGENSQARANLAMRVLRAIFTFASGEYEDAKGRSLFLENPVKRLSHTRAWFRVHRRTTIIKSNELPLWYKALHELQDLRSYGKSAAVRDYLLLILFTGLRREEAAQLKWQQVDFNNKALTVLETKNHLPHTLPLSDFLYELLKNRYIETGKGEFVFQGSGKGGYIVEPRKVMEKITHASGVSFTLHDLRRTFITIAESLDIPAYALKRLLNHKMNQDVTAGYIIMDVERLRKPMQAITDKLLTLMQQKEAQIIHLRKKDSTDAFAN